MRRAALPEDSRNGGSLVPVQTRRAPGGRATGLLDLSGTATGRLAVMGMATGTLLLFGLAGAAGMTVRAAAASGMLPLGGSASGGVAVAALAGGALPLAGSATGTVVTVGVNTITSVTGPAANSVAQRSSTTGGEFGKGIGALTFSVALSADTAVVEYRVLRAENDGVIRDWTVAATSLLAGTRSVTCSAVPARLGWMKVQLRANGSATTFTHPSPVGVGRVIAVSGQSLAVRMFGKMDSQTTTISDLGVTVGPNGVCYATYIDSQRSSTTAAWDFPSNSGPYDSVGAAVLLNDQVAAFGVTCALVGHSRGATAISAFVPGGAESAALRAVLTAVGGFEQFLWFQGHSDSSGSTTQLAYRDALTALFNDMTTFNAVRGGAYARLLCALPNISSTSWGTADRIAAIRQAHVDWLGTNSGSYVQPSDVALVDGVHQSQPGAIALARAFSRAMKGQANPAITAATRISALEIRLDIALSAGATALASVGAPATRFRVFSRGSTGTALTLDAATPLTVGTSAITLKLASDPGAAAALDVWFGLSPDPVADGGADMITDNAADGWTVGRQLQATVRPVTAAALSPAAVGAALTMTSPVYEAASSGFGQRIAGGYGVTASASDNLPASATWTMEARFILASAPPSVRVLCGQSDKAWIGVHSSGRLIAAFSNDSNATSYVGDTTNSAAGTNPLVADGIEHHVALVCTPAQRRLYLDGVLVRASASSGTATSKRGAGSTGFGVNTFGSTPASFAWPGKSDEHAIWETERYIQNFAVPTIPYLGTEAGLRGLWHLDGSGTSGIA